MAWVKVPPEHHPLFRAALPDDPRVETVAMFGGVAARVNGNLFAGLFGRSTMLQLAEPDRGKALALEGAAPFDPMGDGRLRSDKVMLPESMMRDPAGLRRWIARAFEHAAELPVKTKAKKNAKKAAKKRGR
jgi:TfoX/Sxy family transcriptional regulator of competence genes